MSDDNGITVETYTPASSRLKLVLTSASVLVTLLFIALLEAS